MTEGSVCKRSLRVDANGLEHHVLEWASRRARARAVTAFLLHGFAEAGAVWDEIAEVLAAEGHRVLAPDMRGFGEAPRAPRGSYYHFPDYVADLAELIEALAPGEPVALVGHSMGGTIATLYAGAFPERVARLANVEGLGPPDNGWETGPRRMRRWIEEVRATRDRAPKTLSYDEARVRLANAAPGPPERLELRLRSLAREVPGAGGERRFLWRFDPLHRTTAPTPFFAQLFMQFAKQVSCPVLYVSGGASGYHPADEEARLGAFARLERATLEGAGHLVYLTRPDELSRLLVRFLGDAPRADAAVS